MAVYKQPRVGLVDTDPAIDRIWVQLWRQKTPAERLAALDAHTAGVMQMSWGQFQQHMGHLPPDEQRVQWAQRLYGPDLAARLRAYLAARR